MLFVFITSHENNFELKKNVNDEFQSIFTHLFDLFINNSISKINLSISKQFKLFRQLNETNIDINDVKNENSKFTKTRQSTFSFFRRIVEFAFKSKKLIVLIIKK